MDASPHIWFNDIVTHLHLAIGDANGAILGVFFDNQETLKAYYHVTHQIIFNHGIPNKFLTDRRSIFEYKIKKRETAISLFTWFFTTNSFHYYYIKQLLLVNFLCLPTTIFETK